jgi:hypothetical protein
MAIYTAPPQAAYFKRMFIRAGLADLTGIKRVQLAVTLHRERYHVN